MPKTLDDDCKKRLEKYNEYNNLEIIVCIIKDKLMKTYL